MSEKISITPSELMEYMYCPRFIYYMLYLKIPQQEDKRYKVLRGRDAHMRKKSINKNYLRKKIGVKHKLLDQKLYSQRYRIHGIVDEVLFFNDGTGAPLDYKFSRFKNRVFRTHKYQAAMYGLLIQDNFKIEVNRAYLVYIRSKNLLKEIKLREDIFKDVNRVLEDIIEIIHKGYYPNPTKYKSRCRDCTYRNVCVR